VTSAPTDPAAETIYPIDAGLHVALNAAHASGNPSAVAAAQLPLDIRSHSRFPALVAHTSRMTLDVPQRTAHTDKGDLIGVHPPETDRGEAIRLAARIVRDLGIRVSDRDEAVWLALVLAADCTRPPGRGARRKVT
jgi:hypothetical protein